MEQVIHICEEFLRDIANLAIILFEFIGVAIIIRSGICSFYKCIKRG